MKVSYYCQHVLGIGHFHRSLTLCNCIARTCPTTLILGGPPVEADYGDVSLLKLPGLQMDTNFQNMTPCDPHRQLEHVKEERKELLFTHFMQSQPDVFITELYPFGRKAFRFELDPVLKAVKNGTLPDCLCLSSVRDILVEKVSGRDKFERRAVKTLNAYYQGVLVHADQNVITLDETFSHLAEITAPLHYTGFVSKEKTKGGSSIRKELQLSPKDTLIVASIGGGNVGGELLLSVLRAFKRMPDKRLHLQLFCGPYCQEHLYQMLVSETRHNVTVNRFTDSFPDWLETADLSVSMAGYNTCMDLVQSGVPALVYPFQQNREQLLRATKLSTQAPIFILDEELLAPQHLAECMKDQLQKERVVSAINVDGAAGSTLQLEKWYREH